MATRVYEKKEDMVVRLHPSFGMASYQMTQEEYSIFMIMLAMQKETDWQFHTIEIRNATQELEASKHELQLAASRLEKMTIGMPIFDENSTEKDLKVEKHLPFELMELAEYDTKTDVFKGKFHFRMSMIFLDLSKMKIDDNDEF